jgi:hypothetical protein
MRPSGDASVCSAADACDAIATTPKNTTPYRFLNMPLSSDAQVQQTSRTAASGSGIGD